MHHWLLHASHGILLSPCQPPAHKTSNFLLKSGHLMEALHLEQECVRYVQMDERYAGAHVAIAFPALRVYWQKLRVIEHDSHSRRCICQTLKRNTAPTNHCHTNSSLRFAAKGGADKLQGIPPPPQNSPRTTKH